jgi:hypothetical protein
MIYFRKLMAFAALFASVASLAACETVEDDPYHHSSSVHPDDIFQDIQEKVGG